MECWADAPSRSTKLVSDAAREGEQVRVSR